MNDIKSKNIDVVGSNINVSGEIHNYNGNGSNDEISQNGSSNETADLQSSQNGFELIYILHLSDLHFGTMKDA
jgi:hypothetical protein